LLTYFCAAILFACFTLQSTIHFFGGFSNIYGLRLASAFVIFGVSISRAIDVFPCSTDRQCPFNKYYGHTGMSCGRDHVGRAIAIALAGSQDGPTRAASFLTPHAEIFPFIGSRYFFSSHSYWA
jgi:hypothetical protein